MQAILGLIIGVSAILIAMYLEEVNFGTFLSLAAILIVFGGTFGATMLSFPIKKFLNTFKVVKTIFSKPTMTADEVIKILVDFAQKARREGLLALEQDVKSLENEFLRQGIELVVDGNDPELVRTILETQLSFLQERHKSGASVLDSMGGYAPTMGMIGTVSGLISVLGGLTDPNALGPKVALAFVATFWGICLANLIFLPIGSQLKQRSTEEVLLNQLMIEGILSVQAGDNPRIVEEKLKAFLPPSDRQKIVSKTEATE